MPTFAERVRAARKNAGLSQAALAKAAGMSQATISDIERGRNETSNCVALGMALGVSAEWLATGRERPRPRALGVGMDVTGSFGAQATVEPTRQIPVVSYVQAGAPHEIFDPYAPGDGHRRIWLDPDASDRLSAHTFALEIQGRSMEPDYQAGDIIVVDPDQCVRPGDVVVAKVNNNTEATVKKYRDRGRDTAGNPIYELIPLNPDYAPILVDATNPGTMIGPVVEHRRDPRR